MRRKELLEQDWYVARHEGSKSYYVYAGWGEPEDDLMIAECPTLQFAKLIIRLKG